MKIGKIFQEYIFAWSILIIVLGSIMLLIGVNGIWFSNVEVMMFSTVIQSLDGYVAYVFAAGVVVALIGLWYLYDFLRKRKRLLEGLEIQKRSVFQKKHSEFEEISKKLPSKYKKMLEEKEKSLRIK